jgi:sulfite reductase alpha subunit-like flavoprotein
MPLNYFIQCVGPQKVREYSISSYLPGKAVDLTMAVTEMKTKFNRNFVGICSKWLRSATVGEIVPFWLKKGTFIADANQPLIMVGPGTGVAAFRSFIQKLHGKCELVLIFGCRSDADDFYYRDEWL